MVRKILFKIHQSYWLKSGVVVIGTRISLIVLGFIGFLFLIRYLDKDEYGIWIIFITISSLIETVRIGFIKNPLMILNADNTFDKKRLYNASFILNIGLTILIIILIVLVNPIMSDLFESKTISSLLYLYTLKLLLISIGDHIDIVQEVNFDFKGSLLDLFLRNLVFVICIIICFLFKIEIPLYYLVIFQILGVFLGIILSYLNSVQKHIHVFSSFQYDLKYIKELNRLGKFTFGSSISSIVNRNIDTWMLGYILNPSSVAIYNPAIRVANVFEIPTSTMSTILMPKLTNKITSTGPNAVKYYYEKSVSYILIFMIPVIAIGVLFSNEIILVIAGDGFEQTGYLLKFTMFYGLLIPFNRQFSISLDALGKTKLNFIIVLFSLTLNLILNYYFISQFGIVGAVYATILTYFTIFLFSQVYLYTYYKINLLYIFYMIIPNIIFIFNRVKRFYRSIRD